MANESRICDIRAGYTERKCRLRNEEDLNWVKIVNLAYK